jgi:hypothetical protein
MDMDSIAAKKETRACSLPGEGRERNGRPATQEEVVPPTLPATAEVRRRRRPLELSGAAVAGTDWDSGREGRRKHVRNEVED